eukprot:8053292-Pyramimonas_sp.AAC.1
MYRAIQGQLQAVPKEALATEKVKIFEKIKAVSNLSELFSTVDDLSYFLNLKLMVLERMLKYIGTKIEDSPWAEADKFTVYWAAASITINKNPDLVYATEVMPAGSWVQAWTDVLDLLGQAETKLEGDKSIKE